MCSAPPVERPPVIATTTDTCCAGTAKGCCSIRGEGSQRQLILAGESVSSVTRLCLSHFHGDHCLGVPGIVQRLSVNPVPHPVWAYFPAAGQEFFTRLRHACVFNDIVDLREQPVARDGPIAEGAFGIRETRSLDDPIDAIGYRLVEPDSRHFVPELLAR